jgi:hypothetical protein
MSDTKTVVLIPDVAIANLGKWQILQIRSAVLPSRHGLAGPGARATRPVGFSRETLWWSPIV